MFLNICINVLCGLFVLWIIRSKIGHWVDLNHIYFGMERMVLGNGSDYDENKTHLIRNEQK